MNLFKRPKKIIYLIPLLSLFFFMTQCQEEPFNPETTGSIEGKVMDARNQEPLSNVTITSSPSTEVVLTDESGNYKIASIDTGRYTVKAEKDGYQTKSLGINVKENTTSQVQFILEPTDDNFASDIRFTDDFTPQNKSETQPTQLTLTWEALSDGSTSADSLKYDVHLFRDQSLDEFLVKKNLRDTFLHVESLQYDKVYYWQVIARTPARDTIHSQMLRFRTRNISSNFAFFVKKFDGNYEIMAYDFNNSVANQVTYNNYRDWAPRINAQTGKVAFVNDSKVKSFLYTMDKNGGQVRQITDIAVDGYHNQGDAFAWDEDAGKIIFSHYQSLYEVNANGTDLKKIATAPDYRHFKDITLSPNNNQIVAMTIGQKIFNSEIYRMNRDGSNQEVLVEGLPGRLGSPAYSIDGNSILYTYDVSGNQSTDGRMLNSHIFRLDLSSMDTTDLSSNKPLGTNDMDPTYSPTGNKILFTNVVNDNSEPKEIWIMDVDGTDREQVTEGELPSWN